MKFDKIMSIFYRVLCALTCTLVIFGFFVSCFGNSISACADVGLPDWAFPYQQYTQTYEERLEELKTSPQLQTILSDPNVSVSDKRALLNVNALQTFDFKFAYENLQRWNDDDFQNVPDDVTESGFTSSGIYKNSFNGDIKLMDLTYTADGVFCSCPDLTFSYYWQTSSNERHSVNYELRYYDNNTAYLYVLPADYSGRLNLAVNVSGGFNGGAFVVPANRLSDFWCYPSTACYLSFKEQSTSIPIHSGGGDDNNWYNYFRPSPSEGQYASYLCGMGEIVQVPQDTYGSTSPWEYYNTTLLPYLRQNYSSYNFDIDEFLVFPDGYTPDIPDPTEPPTFPNGGIYIDKQYNIGINIIYPTDESGQPITDASGETVTETQYITDTSPLDGEYSFLMPTLPHLNIYDASLPIPDVSSYSDGINFIWNACYNILTDTGFMPVVMICFALALFGFILWKLG